MASKVQFSSSRLCVIKDLIYSTCSKVFGVMETGLLHRWTKYLNRMNSSCRLCGKRVKRAQKDEKQGTNEETLIAAHYIRVYKELVQLLFELLTSESVQRVHKSTVRCFVHQRYTYLRDHTN